VTRALIALAFFEAAACSTGEIGTCPPGRGSFGGAVARS
jgi:hypothetical protein